jgi:hypothetical protein
MTQSSFIILKHMRKAPSMATCERCHIKFFTPLELLSDPMKAENHLRNKFVVHECKREIGSALSWSQRKAS